MLETTLLQQMFGDRFLIEKGATWPSSIQVRHGPLDRLPAVFLQPLLQHTDLLADVYRGPLSFGRGLRSPQTFDTRASAGSLLQLGLTVFMQDVAPALSGAPQFLRDLERELGVASGCARLSAFACAGDDGVSCHYDAEEVISIQLLGRKTFHVAPMDEIPLPYGAQFGPGMVAVENLYEQARDGFPDPAQATFQSFDLQPGSVLFLPRGTWHRTQAQEPSLSLSIVVRPPVLAEALLGWLQPWLLGDARWRLPLYGPVNTQQSALQPLLRELATRLEQGAEQPILSWSATPPIEDTELLQVPGSRLDVIVVSQQRVRLQVTALDQNWRSRTTFDSEIPATLLPVIEWIQQQKTAFSLQRLARALPHIVLGDSRQLLELLVKAHALRQLVPR
ncbi:cupin domain-containing protein [Pseudomonas sp. SIMBA_077]